MNSTIQKKKIDLYKKQVRDAYIGCEILDVYHGEELALYQKFNQQKSLSTSIKRSKFSYYDSQSNLFLNKEIPYSEAFACFMENSIIFQEGQVVIYFVLFKDEIFGLKMLFDKKTIETSRKLNQEDLLLISEDLKKLLGLDILEYEIEILVFDADTLP